MNEMELWSAKFEQYEQDKSSVSDLISVKKTSNIGMSGARSNSLGNRLYQRQNVKTAPEQTASNNDSEDPGQDEEIS